jgi:hypothetical protein
MVYLRDNIINLISLVMFKKILKISCLLALGLSISSCSSVHKMFHGEKHAQKMFERMDLNKDGKVTKYEFKKYGDEKFKKMDANKNGVLCIREFLDHKKSYHKGK